MSEADGADGDRLLGLIQGAWPTQVLAMAARLELAECLQAGPLPAETLASSLNLPCEPLRRLLRALCALDVLHEQVDGSFRLTTMGARLAADHPQSLQATALWWGEHLWPLWTALPEAVRQGCSARQLQLGTEGFVHLDNDPSATALFHRFGRELSRFSLPALLKAGDFQSCHQVVDVGAGSGVLLAAVLQAFPQCEGVYFDRPSAVHVARKQPDFLSMGDRCQFVSGDFFQEVPGGADLYLLKAILHDWDDAAAVCILSVLRRAMNPRSRLLVIEQVLPARLNGAECAGLACSDLTMLLAHSGRERTLDDFQSLLASAGLLLEQHQSLQGSLTMLQVIPQT